MSFNPSSSFTGNGTGQVTINYSSTLTSWTVNTLNLPGSVQTGVFPNTQNPTGILSQNFSFTWPVRGGKNIAAAIKPSLGVNTPIGISVVGIVLYGPSTNITVNGLNNTSWTLNAVEVGVAGEDAYGGSTTVAGTYNYRDSRFISNDAWGTITNSTWEGGYQQTDGHSKLIGWARDGYPIYGPYGYTNPFSTTSTSRMVSGYYPVTKPNRPLAKTLIVANSVTSSTTILVYSAAGVGLGMTVTGTGMPAGLRIMKITGVQITFNQPITISSGAALNATFPAGCFMEDWAWANSAGVTLDVYNGRYCKTPEYPEGTYAYFLSETNSGTPYYPYIVGVNFYGSLNQDNNNTSLSNLIPSVGTLSPEFTSSTLDYNLTVTNATTSVSFIPSVSTATSKITVNSILVNSGSSSPTIPVIVGLNTTTIKVSSQYQTTGTYNIVVNRLKNSNNNLSKLGINPGIVTPSFDPTVTSYNIVVPEIEPNLYIVPSVENNLSTVKVNTSTVISGQVSSVPLTFGYNSITVEVTAQDSSKKTYNLTAIRLSKNSSLNTLSVSTGTLTPAFNKDSFYYSLNVPNAVRSLNLTATMVDSGETLYFNGVQTPSGQTYTATNLVTGINVITAKVRSSDLSTEHNYRINIFRGLSSNANLSSLTYAEGTFTNAFSSSTVQYSAVVENQIKTITINATTWEDGSTLKINGISAKSGVYTLPIPLVVGVNSIPVEVTPPDLSSPKTYTINVSRKGSSVSTLSNIIVLGGILSPRFSALTTNYTLPINYNTTGIKIRPFASDPTSTITVNNLSVLSGNTSTNIITPFGVSTITVKVVSQTLANTTTYVINAIRERNYDATLALLEVTGVTLNPAFNSATTEYSYTVSGSANATEITAYLNDPNARLLINSNTATSGVPVSVSVTGTYVLNTFTNKNEWIGLNVIPVKVVAANPLYEKTYNLNVTKLPSGVSTLNSLVVDGGSFTPSFSPSVYEYYLNLPYAVNQVRIKADATDVNSNLLVNFNYIVPSGQYSPYFRVYVGNQNIPVLVESPSKENITGYNIFINRAGIGASTDADLLKLETDIGTIVPAFDKNTLDYKLSVSGTVTQIKIKPSASNLQASIKVNDIHVISGQYSNYINLVGVITTCTVKVTAGDNATIKNYIVTVEKEKSPNSYLTNLLLSTSKVNEIFTSTKTEYTVELPYYTKNVSIKPFGQDSQQRIGVQGLLVGSGTWSQVVPVSSATTTVLIDVTAGNLINRTIYKLILKRDTAIITNPANLFLKNSNNTVYAQLVNKESLRIFSKGKTTYISAGTFPNSYIRYPVLDQKIDVIYPYRGGTSQESKELELRDANTNTVGITLVGIPIRNPRSSTIISGLNSSTWTLDANFNIKTMPRDAYSGGPDSTGAYYYLNNRFISSNAWATTTGWNGDYDHDDGHSRIVGFSADGYPIYGPYGYVYSASPLGGVTKMTSGYTTKQSPNRPEPIEVRTQFFVDGTDILLQDASKVQVGMRLVGGTITLAQDVTVLSITSSTVTVDRTVSLGVDIPLTGYWPLGAFVEDYVYSITTATLDKHNGRYCVTPEYPLGTYAYFMTDVNNIPSYPYVIGNTFYSPISITPVNSSATKPVWKTSPGMLYTATELLSMSYTVSATGSNVRYRLINGSLPKGLSLNTSTGVISGTPSVVWLTERSEFVLRAYNEYGVADRSFILDGLGPTPPRFITPGIEPAVGPSGEKYLINGQKVDFQFTATTDVLAPGRSITYHIADGDGQLPPGLTLTIDGRLYGQVKDTLSLFYQAASNGNFDIEGWDSSPLEHESLQAIGVGPRYVNKTYKFIITASNGAGSARQLYQIDVNDPSYDKSKYPVAPQWITQTDLGSIRANTKQVIQLETYDCDPGSGTIRYEWDNVNDNLPILPQDLALDPITGTMSGYLRYTPVYSSVYTFKVRVSKTSLITGMTQYRDRTFNLTILGAIISKMTFLTDFNIGTLYQGQQSELTVLAIHEDPAIKIRYSLQSGALPPGISLTNDGTFAGVVPYNTATTVLTNYDFSIRAIDSNLGGQLIKNFRIQVQPYQNKEYTKVLLQPLLSLEQRTYWNTFINDPTIFDTTLLYRPYDPAFGIQKDLEFVLEWGVQKLRVAQYVTALQNYFYRKRLYFGNLKSAFALDDNGNKLYEVVYVELVDELVNESGVPINPVVQYDDIIIYPNSIDGMRGALESISSPDEFYLPKFMKTVQDSTGVPLGRILCLPLCYCLPGNAQTIIRRIEAFGIDFKLINFDLDRIIVLNTLDNSQAKYLLFPKRGFLL